MIKFKTPNTIQLIKPSKDLRAKLKLNKVVGHTLSHFNDTSTVTDYEMHEYYQAALAKSALRSRDREEVKR